MIFVHTWLFSIMTLVLQGPSNVADYAAVDAYDMRVFILDIGIQELNLRNLFQLLVDLLVSACVMN